MGEKKGALEDLRKKNELKNKWISLIAHDFKGVFSTLAWLLNAYETETITHEQLLEFLPEVKQNVNQNQRTITDTLAWVERQMDGFVPESESIPLQDFLETILKEYRKEIEEKEIQLTISVDSKLVIDSDKVMLRFILNRTIENAIKYSYIGAEVAIEAEKNNSGLFVRITDYGIGMDEHSTQAIGELSVNPFSGTGGEKGANLSLVIVKEFIEMLKGNMTISSKLEGGTCVTLSFPFTDID